MGSTYLSVLIPTPRRTARQRSLLWGAAVASLLACGVALPVVWNLLGLIHTQARGDWLAHHLAQAPMAAWLMMLVWGTAVPLCLLATLWGGLRWRGVLLTTGLALWAVAWYVHMPELSQCAAAYGGTVCAALQLAYPLSLGLALAVHLFALCLLLLSGLGLLSLSTLQPDELELYRYGA